MSQTRPGCAPLVLGIRGGFGMILTLLGLVLTSFGAVQGLLGQMIQLTVPLMYSSLHVAK